MEVNIQPFAATPQNGDDRQKKNRTNPNLEPKLMKDRTH
jgi:hypothetical protein